MRDWKEDRREMFQNNILAQNQMPDDGKCNTCGESGGLWRCRDCHGDRVLCRTCCRDSHSSNPFHRIEYWNGRHFEGDWLVNLGLVLNLGHAGDACPGLTVGLGASSMQELTGDVKYIYKSPSGTRDVPSRSTLMTVGHTNGMHKVWVRYCGCVEKAPLLDMQLMSSKLYPMSSKSPQTAFTFELLDNFMMANLECKTTPYQYYHMLRRLTNPAFPAKVEDRYRELMRASRQWRNLKLRIRAGVAAAVNNAGPGSQALFCATCVQPGINAPENFEDDPVQAPYMRSFVIDGNFKATHRKRMNADTDVPLTDGEFFMVNEKQYQAHLTEATEDKSPASTCNEYHAVNDRFTKHKGMDVTGIGATACARHGCFCPGSVVGFQKGEK